MSGQLGVAVAQMEMEADASANIDRAMSLVESAAASGSQVVVLPELFALPYFCKDQNPAWFDTAITFPDNRLFSTFSALARRLGVSIVVSFFEREGMSFFNAATVIDETGELKGRYRKSHIPDGPGYQEKFYFSPGDTGFQVFEVSGVRIGLGICWDQWFPEQARALTLAGADIIVYPTAIGSEPQNPKLDSRDHWQRTMAGHSAANLIPVAASNRIGREVGQTSEITFYGHSFVTDHLGAIVFDAGDRAGAFNVQLDLSEARDARVAWGVFRDRRPELYERLTRY
ncbi:MAG: N-carbamoylputrescine amidase [Actinomycetota bacterium]|nr:N-carbamoylputrescine amidase [Actinomycetota bacterium]